MKKVAILAFNSWQENLRSRFYLLTLVFSGVVLYMSLLLGILSSDQDKRVLLDFGLGFIELMGLAGALYGAATIILKEMETKTIYLILTRPVSRGQYLLGRFLGLMLSVLASMSLMACVHLAILLFKGWSWESSYVLAFIGAYLKVLITAAMAVFLALSSSSVLTALTIACIIWTLGHFLPEIRFMIAWGAPKPAMAPLKLLSCILPDLQLLNYRDRLSATSAAAAQAPLWQGLLYSALYASVWLALSRCLLRRKEF